MISEMELANGGLPLELGEIILAAGPKEEKKAAFLRKMKDGREEKRIYACS